MEALLRKAHLASFYDEKGAIGRRYRRQDEIGTPYCVTIDGDTLSDGTVTLRHRDSMEQEKVALDELVQVIHERTAAWERPVPQAGPE